MINQNALSRRVQPFAVFAALTVAVCAFTQPVHADTDPSVTRSVRINLSGLDLSTLQGQETAKARLLEAARLSCLRVEDQLDLSRHDNYLACVDSALTQAMPRLTQLISRNSSVQMAGIASK